MYGWELECKESWMPRNLWFWTMMLEKTLESFLDGKKIKPVHPKRNQSFIRRTDAEAETPILWPPNGKNWLIGKAPDAGKDWRQQEKGMTEDETVRWLHRLDWHQFEQALGDGAGQGGLATAYGVTKSDTEWLTGNDAEAEVPILWPPMGRTDWLVKALMLGKIEGRGRRQWQRMRWLDAITYSMDMNLSNPWNIVEDREAWPVTVHLALKFWTGLSNWTKIIIQNDLPQGALPLCWKILPYSLPEVSHFSRYLQDNGLYFLKSSPSLYYKRIWHPDPHKMVILRH